MDIFEKNFLFLPIHDHLHWSLVIICHPGVPAEEDSCTPWILHLDSMTCECHSSLRRCSSVDLCAPCARTRLSAMVWMLQFAVPFEDQCIASQLILSPFCSWSQHCKDQEGAAGVPHPGMGPEGAARSELSTLISNHQCFNPQLLSLPICVIRHAQMPDLWQLLGLRLHAQTMLTQTPGLCFSWGCDSDVGVSCGQ